MYKEKTHEKGYDMPTAIHRPELSLIIENLRNAVERYESILCETKQKLQMIKKYDELSTLKDDIREIQPESVTEEINWLLCRLDDLNEKAEGNLRHLREIV